LFLIAYYAFGILAVEIAHAIGFAISFFFSMWWCSRRGWTYLNNIRGLRPGSVFFKSAATLSPGTESMWTSKF
jgi:hypothetical protein